MESSTPVLMIMFTFTFFPLVLAEFARKKSLPTVSDFFLQSRSMSTFMIFFTIYATWMSAFAFLGASGYFYMKGPVYMTTVAWDALFGLLIFGLGERIWSYGKLNGYVTPVDFFHDIYGSKVLNLIIILVQLIFTLIYLQIQFSAGAYLIEIASGGIIPWEIGGLLFYLIIIIYLWAGGLRAVALTDIFYSILLFVSMMFIGVYLVQKAGGFSEVFLTIFAEDEASVTLTGPEGGAGMLLWVCLFITVPIGAVMGPQMWIRMYAVRERRAFSLIPFLLCLTAIQCMGTLLAGSAARVLNPVLEEPDKIIPIILLEYAEPVLCTLMFCGIASAALSTANSQIHAISAIYTVDIHKKYINPMASDRDLVSVAKWAVLVVSVVTYLFLLRSPSLMIETGTLALGGTAQIAVPTAGALFWSRSHPKAAAIGIAAGIAGLLLLFFIFGIEAAYCTVIALISNTILFIVLSLMLKQDLKTSIKISGYKAAYQAGRI